MRTCGKGMQSTQVKQDLLIQDRKVKLLHNIVTS